jgi:hypothetical protein
MVAAVEEGGEGKRQEHTLHGQVVHFMLLDYK